MLLAAAVLAAAPVYLSCDLGSGQQKELVDVAVDEANQRVTIARKEGAVSALPALFSPNEVRADERIGGETMTWIINRSDLTLTTKVTFSPTSRTSACRIKPAPAKRAF